MLYTVRDLIILSEYKFGFLLFWTLIFVAGITYRDIKVQLQYVAESV